MSHFTRDARVISERALSDVNAFFWVGIFVILTIRQPFYQMAPQFADVQKNGAASRYLFGWKRKAFHYLAENKAELQAAALAFKAGTLPFDSLILRYLEIPGLGIVKASFLAQMTVSHGACLDTHNLKALGLDENAFKVPKTLKVATIAKRIIAYNAVWQALGDSAHWWDKWCELVASLYPQRFADGAAVSALHLLPVKESA